MDGIWGGNAVEQTLSRLRALDAQPTPAPDPGGAPRTLADLYREHRTRMVRLAVLLVDDPNTAEDVVQDAFLGLYNAGQILNNGVGHAPMERRADVLTPQGVRLRYVQCPQAPFNNSDEQNVCAGK